MSSSFQLSRPSKLNLAHRKAPIDTEKDGRDTTQMNLAGQAKNRTTRIGILLQISLSLFNGYQYEDSGERL